MPKVSRIAAAERGTRGRLAVPSSRPRSRPAGNRHRAPAGAVLLQAEILDLKANPTGKGHGTGPGGELDPGKGPWRLSRAARHPGRWRHFIAADSPDGFARFTTNGARPSRRPDPPSGAKILGFEGVPAAGDIFAVVTDAVEARDIAQKAAAARARGPEPRSAKGPRWRT